MKALDASKTHDVFIVDDESREIVGVAGKAIPANRLERRVETAGNRINWMRFTISVAEAGQFKKGDVLPMDQEVEV